MHIQSPDSIRDRGYMGDRRRGASLGRSNFDDRSQLTINALRRDIADDESTIGQLKDGSFVPGWHDWNRDTGESTFTPNFATPELLAAHIAKREALTAGKRARLARLVAAPEILKLHLQRVPLDSGGYDRGGAYWGCGRLYVAFDDDGIYQQFVRARDREAARREILEDCDDVTFYASRWDRLS